MAGLKEMASVIINQMGGFGKLRAMVGAKDFVYGKDEDSPTSTGFVQFSFKGSRKANKCKVILDGDDTYTLELWKVSMRSPNPDRWCVLKYSASGLYEDMLKPIFEKETKLYLSI